MATDVSGTIHIIAEVMGDSNSPNVAPGQGSAIGPDKRIGKTAKSLSIMGVQIRKIIKLMTVGGLLKFSQNISNSLNGIFQMVGALVDLFFIPFAPAFIRALDTLYPILGYLALLSVGEKNMGDIWGDMGDWWAKQVEENGVWGAIKELTLDVSAVGLLAGLLVIADPTGTGWKAAKYLTVRLFKGAGFARSFILDAFNPARGPKWGQKGYMSRDKTAGKGFRRTINKSVVNIKALLKSGDFKGMLWKGALVGKSWVSKSFGFIINLVPFLGGSKWKAAAKLTSKFAMIGVGGGIQVIKFLMQTAAGTAIKAGIMGGAGAALTAFIAGMVVIAGTVVGVAWLMQKLFPFDDPDYVQNQIKQSQEEGDARSREPSEQYGTFIFNDYEQTAKAELDAANKIESRKQQVLINRQIPVFP